MRNLHWDDFRDAAGSDWEVESGGDRHRLRLDLVAPLPDSGREGGGFRLEFLGPAAPALPQATYVFVREGGEPAEIFIVPVAREAAGMRYEAIFN